MSAERAWALGMELKQAANTEHRKKFHLMRRLQRSVKHANELLQLCEGSERCDARTRLEAQVRGREREREREGGREREKSSSHLTPPC